MLVSIYIRVSTQEQIENYSLESQKERLEAFCKAKGWDVYKVYVDPGYSGATLDRPALQEMLLDLKEVDVVAVYKLDRLSRSQRDTLTLIEEHFLKNDVDFVSITETIDTSTPFGKAMIGILSVFAQLERETIAERMRMGHIKRAEEGLRGMGGDYDPAGYARKDGQLVLKDDEAKHIQLVYDLYEQYHSITKVQKRLKELGGTVWRFRRYRDILSNRLYCGYVKFAGSEYKGQHEAIISEDQFERVQALLSRHAGNNAHRAKQSLFSMLIVCGQCGEIYQTYQAHKGKYRYYICRARRFPSEYPKRCENKTWNYAQIEDHVMREIKNVSQRKSANYKQTEKIDYKKKFEKLDKKIERILELYADGDIDKNALDNQIQKINAEKQETITAQKQQDAQLVTLTHGQLSDLVFDLENAPFDEKQAIVNKLINRIIIDGETIHIEWNF